MQLLGYHHFIAELELRDLKYLNYPTTKTLLPIQESYIECEFTTYLREGGIQ